MITPKVTAIVSAYYAEQYLEGRICNLLMQSPIPEIVVVCQVGGVEEEIAKQHWSAHEDIRIVHTLDIPTIYDAWNQAIRFSTGKYIVNANSDDRFEYDALKDMAKELDLFPDRAMVYGASNVIDIFGKINNIIGNRDGNFDRLKNDYFVGPMPMWRRSLHDKYGWFDETFQVAGDYEFWLRCAKGGEKFYRLPRVVGTYLKRPDSAEHRQPIVAKYENKLVRERFAT